MEHSRIIVEAEQRSPEWHAARLGVFTSSEIYRLMTKPKLKGEVLSDGAKTYIMEKVAESLTGIREEVFTTQAMQWGIDNEPLAKKHLARLNGWTIEETSFIKIDSLNYGGSGDGWIRELNGALEVKCLNTVNHLKEIRDSEDLKANSPMRFWQVLSDAYLRECDVAVLAWFDPRIPNDFGLFTKKFKVDQADVNEMLEKIRLANEYFKQQLEYFTKI
jgi:hypothetical protein